jgi:3-deoxy-D-manno-octulosonic-acid transferase
VGGSLFPHGGQNMMEPAGLGRAVVFGPHVQNFQESVDILLDGEAAKMVNDTAELKEVILALADDPVGAEAMGERARRIVIEHKGASERIMDMIRPHFSAPGKAVQAKDRREER